MQTKSRMLMLFVILAVSSLGATVYTWEGPDYVKGPKEGLPCTPGEPSCILGDPGLYQVFGAQLITSDTQPWILTIYTNYGDPNKTIMPGTPYPYEGVNFTLGDFLIMWNGGNYGIALSSHDGYTPGDLYKVNSYQTSGSIMQSLVTDIPNPSHNVWLGPGGQLLGTGTLSSARTGDGVNTAAYTITNTFTVPPAFLENGSFSVDFSSYACANGIIMGQGTTENAMPEPNTLALLATAGLLLVCRRLARRA